MPASRTILAAAASSAAALAFAAPASAATIATDACVRHVGSGVKTFPVSGTGFTPGASVTLRYASVLSPTPAFLGVVTADTAGNITPTALTPALFNKFNTQEQSFALSATDGTNPAIVAATMFKQVRVGYLTSPATGRPGRSARHTVRGYPNGKATYLHFRYRGKTRRNVRLGVTSSPCGIVSRRMALLPTRSIPGPWTVYVDQTRTYKKGSPFQLKYSFTIRRTFR